MVLLARTERLGVIRSICALTGQPGALSWAVMHLSSGALVASAAIIPAALNLMQQAEALDITRAPLPPVVRAALDTLCDEADCVRHCPCGDHPTMWWRQP